MGLFLTKNTGLDIEPLSGFQNGGAIIYPAFHARLFTLEPLSGFAHYPTMFLNRILLLITVSKHVHCELLVVLLKPTYSMFYKKMSLVTKQREVKDNRNVLSIKN